MTIFQKQLFQTLSTVEGSGTFMSSSVKTFIQPGLEVEGVGELGFPLPPILTKSLIKVAHKAPFGKGSETVLDENVRSAWEIDEDELTFNNEDWELFLNRILASIKRDLGIADREVEASLYKMLIYEEGDFFLPHQDSEKEPGMFGTLVVGLPSKHTGGEIHVRFGGEEEVVDFSPAASDYKIPYVAFYADCEHEIKKVTSGYRVCLVYNLIQRINSPKIQSPEFGTQQQRLAKLLKDNTLIFANRPKAILLGHQYTPTNFSKNTLKNNDAPRAEVLLNAAVEAGYFANLALVTNHLSGELMEDYDDYYYRKRSKRRYYDDYDDYEEEEDDGDAKMGEVYEHTIDVKHWQENDLPDLGYLTFEESDLIAEFTVGEGDPIEQEKEGYTGNAGMTLDYWYHYGAVILWPKSSHAEILNNRPIATQMNWIDFYLKHWEDEELGSQAFVKRVIEGLQQETKSEEDDFRKGQSDYTTVAKGLVQIGDKSFMKNSLPLLTNVFADVRRPEWVALIQKFDPLYFDSVFVSNGNSRNPLKVNFLLNLLKDFLGTEDYKLQSFAHQHIEHLPKYFAQLAFVKEQESTFSFNPNYRYFYNYNTSKEETIKALISNTLKLSQTKEEDTDWVEKTTASITKKINRPFINEILTPTLLAELPPHTALANALRQVCIEDLQKRTEIKPSPPPTWTRPVPEKNNSHGYYSYDDVWKMLKAFLQSPTEQTYRYTANQDYRDRVTAAIKSVEIDLSYVTSKVGRPYTLILKKTQAAYEKDLNRWKEDMELLGKLR
ncbi:MAG: 2OG-Fe(II) oxygenase [Bacteroidota bacterium]